MREFINMEVRKQKYAIKPQWQKNTNRKSHG